MRETVIQQLAVALCSAAGRDPYASVIGNWVEMRGGRWVEDYGFHPAWKDYGQRADELLPRDEGEAQALRMVMAGPVAVL